MLAAAFGASGGIVGGGLSTIDRVVPDAGGTFDGTALEFSEYEVLRVLVVDVIVPII